MPYFMLTLHASEWNSISDNMSQRIKAFNFWLIKKHVDKHNNLPMHQTFSSLAEAGSSRLLVRAALALHFSSLCCCIFCSMRAFSVYRTTGQPNRHVHSTTIFEKGEKWSVAFYALTLLKHRTPNVFRCLVKWKQREWNV